MADEKRKYWNGEGTDPTLPEALSGLVDAHDPAIKGQMSWQIICALAERGESVVSALTNTHPEILRLVNGYLEDHPGTYDEADLAAGIKKDFPLSGIFGY